MRLAYPIKQWIFTLVLAPIAVHLYQLLGASSGGYVGDFLGPYIFTLGFSLVFSTPALLIYFAVFNILKRRTTDPLIVKFFSIILVVAGIIGTLKAVLPDAPIWTTFKIAYSIFAIIGGLIFEIEDDSVPDEGATE